MTLVEPLAAPDVQAWLARHSPDERHLVAQIKRLLERCDADPALRDRLTQAPNEAQVQVAAYRIEIDPRAVLPLIDGRPADNGDWPLVALWDSYAAAHNRLRETIRPAGDCSAAQPRFAAWRNRQIRRCVAELAELADNINHPILAYELSAGCSVGCWFCGFAAARLRGHFAYTAENAALWRAMLAATVRIFGPAARSMLCYWATDPCDNPDYPSFLEDVRAIVGAVPQSTTAVPMRDPALTRRILKVQAEHGGLGNRFSILTLKQLDKIHAEFSPEEMLHVQLALQNPEAHRGKAHAGRARGQWPRNVADNREARDIDDATIACVSGFLINMVERNVKLVTPVPASEAWPLGYRIYETRIFETAEDFAAAIETMIDAHMPLAPARRTPLRFRPDLGYRNTETGFELQAKGNRFALDGPGARQLGALIERGQSPPAAARAALMQDGIDMLAATGLVQTIYDRGLLAD